MTKATQQEELRKRANEILKGVDQLIKLGKLDIAYQEIARAKTIDPRNSYIYAFEERISVLREEQEKKRSGEAAGAQMEAAIQQKLAAERIRADGERKKKEAEAKQKLEEEQRRKAEEAKRLQQVKQEPPNGPVGERTKIELEAKRTFQEEFTRAEELNRKKAPGVSSPANDAHAMYKRVLLLAWADGALSKEEQSQLTAMRSSLSISDADHEALNRAARTESYAHAFRLVWTSGHNAKERAAVVNELRTKFQIPAQEQPKIESKVLAEMGPEHQQQTVVVIEDDDAILKLIVQVLENSGFAVRPYSTSDEAIVALRDLRPDAILSDINLDTSSMGGFSFYEHVRRLDHLLNTPFLFLSGLTDEGMVRYGKGLGADDYLTKPFSSDLLLDTIKGKIKRFRLLRRP